MRDLLDAIERYYDAAPRAAAEVEMLGPLTLFANLGPGWSYYARPTPGSHAFMIDDVLRVRARQRALGVPEAFEWVSELTPGLAAAVEGAGLQITAHPLLVLNDGERRRHETPSGVTMRIVTPEDDLASLGAVAAVGFESPGTAIGQAGSAELAGARARRTPEQVAFERRRLQTGLTVMAAAYIDGQPVAVGSHQPVGSVSEVVGVATLPAYRRRGIGGALTDLLVEDATARAIKTVFLSADDDAVARVYERLGFRRVATACVAEAAEHR